MTPPLAITCWLGRWGISTLAPATQAQREPSVASMLSTGIGAVSLPTPQRSLAGGQVALPPPAGTLINSLCLALLVDRAGSSQALAAGGRSPCCRLWAGLFEATGDGTTAPACPGSVNQGRGEHLHHPDV